ncbi:hypothetical protein TI39_contig4278g00017 [Zymoseptoria brevis]|uniref:Uncharacterized protein n=1 Tax=Zymoseptoria brevis TaxID=1047168 RepID=A0A0F4G8C6_9PEZI|nr:hypothetical protein TI39_contig4278g00017 [Zymoseptoria brevis]
MAPYRAPGRSNRSGRSNADNDVFEGLPVKQWGQLYARVSLAPPVTEVVSGEDDKWADPPMPRDYQMLSPWTQQLLRLARSGKVGTKRKQDLDALDDDKPEDDIAEEANKSVNVEDRGYIAKKWKPVPEHLLEPEHKHFEFLAKRRKGLPSLYGPEQQSVLDVPMRKTKVQKTDANGEIAIYDVLIPEGQTVEGEVTESTELADAKPVVAAPGTVIEGVGIANEEGVVVAEHLKPTVAPRRNRPPPKKKGGPGRGKKRVTFTNPDGSTYTTVVPNATKIVPQPGQTVKHVAKGEEAGADVTAAQAAAAAPGEEGAEGGQEVGEDGGSGSDSGDDDGDDDDDREDGELSGDEAPTHGEGNAAALPTDAAPPAPTNDTAEPMEDVQPTNDNTKPEPVENMEAEPLPSHQDETQAMPSAATDQIAQDPPSSPDLPLAVISHSRSASMADAPPMSLDAEGPDAESQVAEQAPKPMEEVKTTEEPSAEGPAKEEPAPMIEENPEPDAVEKTPAVMKEVAETVAKLPVAAVEQPLAVATGVPAEEEAPAGSAEVELAKVRPAEGHPEPEAPAYEALTPIAHEVEEEPDKPDDGEDDLLGNLEKHLGNES